MTNPSSFQEIILKLQDFCYLNRPEGSLGKNLPDIQTFGTVRTLYYQPRRRPAPPTSVT
jgi:hypothetical protein